MFARLWWKEYRVFGPVWLAMGVAQLLLQWAFLSSPADVDARSGVATVVAFAWSLLYAFAAASAAFAGERESKTLGFLDALPVDRWTLWLGKASFAIVSTIGLTLTLAALATLAANKRDVYGYSRDVPVFVLFLFEAVAWGLLWSSLTANPLLAGAMSVVSVGATLFLSMTLADYLQLPGGGDAAMPASLAIRTLAALGALGGSALRMAWRPSRRAAPRERAAPRALRPAPLRGSSTGRSLVWQAIREGWTSWAVVLLLGLVMPVGAWIRGFGLPSDWVLDGLMTGIAALVAGVSIFGTEYGSGGRRFLVQHAVRPSVAWWHKVLTWGVGLAAIVAIRWQIVPAQELSRGGLRAPEDWSSLVLLVAANALAVGVVCGMAIRRRITAALVDVLALVGLLPIAIGLATQGMVPTWSLFAIPACLLAASLAWSGDWMLEREGARPWVRLGALIVVPFALLGLCYVTYRALGVEDIGPQGDRTARALPAIPDDGDGLGAYRRAIGLVRAPVPLVSKDEADTAPLDAAIGAEWDPGNGPVVAYWKANLEAIDRARSASTTPTIPAGASGIARGLVELGRLLALDARERTARGDLPGAWDDVLALTQVARQLGISPSGLVDAESAALMEYRAVGLAFLWLGDARQTPATCRKALGDLKALPAPLDASGAIRAEAGPVERLLDRSADELAVMFLGIEDGRMPSSFEYALFTRVIAPPWERARARRVCRMLLSRELRIAGLEPWQRGPDAVSPRPDPGPRRPVFGSIADVPGRSLADFRGSHLARLVLPSFDAFITRLDVDLARRKALVLAVAVVTWKLEHEGRYPESLEALVPGLLPALPVDPFSGGPFDYRLSPGLRLEVAAGEAPAPVPAPHPFISSVGPDGKRDVDRWLGYPGPNGTGDLIFSVR